MIKEEAYNMMSEGYMVTHKLFKPGEFLYMDKQFIIRNEDGTTFENDWDVLTSPEWNIDWFIYKGKFKKGIPSRTPIQRMDTSKIPMMDTGRLDYKEPLKIETLDDYEEYVEYNSSDADNTLELYEEVSKMEDQYNTESKINIGIFSLAFGICCILAGILLNILVISRLCDGINIFITILCIILFLLCTTISIYKFKRR
jgi:Ca2+/Na+ antiporter